MATKSWVADSLFEKYEQILLLLHEQLNAGVRQWVLAAAALSPSALSYRRIASAKTADNQGGAAAARIADQDA